MLTAFDNFDHHDNHGENPALRNLHSNHNELTIETSSRIARPATRPLNRNNNNLVTNDRKPPNPIRARASELPRNEPRNELRNEPVRSAEPARSNDLPANGNARRNVQPANNLLSNATVTIDSKCLDCICYGSTKCNLR